MRIISITETDLIRKIAKHFRTKPLKPVCKQFKDGEPYLRLQNNFNNEDVVVIQSFNKSVSQKLINLFLLLEALSKQKPKSIILVLPFCPFRRQDKIVKKGEGIPLQMFFSLLSIFPIRKIITVDLHSTNLLPAIVDNIETSALFAKYFIDKKIDLVLSPDEGSINRCRVLAKILNTQMKYIKKQRKGYKITLSRGSHGLLGTYRSVLIYDDEIDTGNTILKSMQLIPKNSKVYIAATHGVFSKVNNRIFKRATEVSVTNSLSQNIPFTNFRILPLHEIISNCIKKQLD